MLVLKISFPRKTIRCRILILVIKHVTYLTVIKNYTTQTMKQLSKKIFYLLAIVIVISCKSNQTATKPIKVNSEPNGAYSKSLKVITGTLSKSEYLELKSQLEKELNTKIPEGKSILINYDQGAKNCISIKFKNQYVNSGIEISNELYSRYNIINFFVYSKNSLSKIIFSKNPIYKLDSGFFYDTIFTLHENCSAFYLLKPNGDFYKNYGEDYYSDVIKILKKKN